MLADGIQLLTDSSSFFGEGDSLVVVLSTSNEIINVGVVTESLYSRLGRLVLAEMVEKRGPEQERT